MSSKRFQLLRPDGAAGEAERAATWTEDTLRTTAQQQEAVAHFGQLALAGVALPMLLEAAAAIVARCLDAELSCLFELRPETRTLALRAGVGWAPGCLGRATVLSDLQSHAGYVLRSATAVVVEDLSTDARFRPPPLLLEHGVVSGVSVVVPGKDRPFGLLGAHSTRRREFTLHDVHFLHAVANVLATAIERTRTEDALRKSEEQFRSLIENASDIVTIVGADGLFRYASPSVERLLGYHPRELLQRNAFEFIHPDDVGTVATALSQAIQHPGAPQAAAFRFRHRGGSWRDLESVGQARLDAQGDATLIVNSRDVTERSLHERALRESEERLRTIVAGAPLVLFALDERGVFTLAEGKGLDRVGLRARRLVGHSAFEMYADFPEILADVRRALAGESFSATVEMFGVVFETWCSPIRDPKGRVVGVMGVATDVTERCRAEDALRRSETSNRALVEHATIGIYRSTPAGRFVAVNPALVTMLGYESEDEVLRLDLARDVYAVPEERDRLLARLVEVGTLTGEADWKRRDGRRIRVRLSGRAVRDAAGRLESIETLAEDVSERRVLEEQLLHSQRLEALGQFTGGIAHDFNNLLTIILANAQLVEKAVPREPAALHRDLRDIVSAALRGKVMIKELLGFARRSSLELQPLDVSALVADLATILRRILPADIEIISAPAANLPDARADLYAVEQILFNLATNARDAMPAGGVLRLETARGGPASSDGDYVWLSVEDTGIGMDEATRQRAFEPFFTTKDPGRGTGLGLATVYGLVKQHGGLIELDSVPGRGTRVKVYLPVAESGAPATTHRVSGGHQVPGGAETILVVEDDDQLRRAVQASLENAGYVVRIARDGAEALEVLRRDAAGIDLVFSDLVMPKLGGRGLREAARREGVTVPFLFASGYAGPTAHPDADPDEPPYLHKPWVQEDLLRSVRQALDAGEPG